MDSLENHSEGKYKIYCIVSFSLILMHYAILQNFQPSNLLNLLSQIELRAVEK